MVGVKDFQNHFWAPHENLDTATLDATLSESDALRPDDLLFVRSNGNIDLIGRSLLVGEVREKTTHSGFTIRARLETREVQPRFLCHYVKSDRVRQQMIAGGTGTNIKSLSQGILAELVIPMPPLDLQSRIVGEVEALQQDVRGLEAVYRRRLDALDELNQSLLHQAFAGEL